MNNIRNLFSQKLLASLRRQNPGTIYRRKLKVEQLEDRSNPAPLSGLDDTTLPLGWAPPSNATTIGLTAFLSGEPVAPPAPAASAGKVYRLLGSQVKPGAVIQLVGDTAAVTAAPSPPTTVPPAAAVTSTAPNTLDSAELTDAQRQAIEQVVRDSTDKIWFEKNEGQYPEGVLYGFRTSFGATLVYSDHLTIISTQTDPVTGDYMGRQVVEIHFTGSDGNWSIVPGGKSDVLGSYQRDDGSTVSPEMFNELTLRNVYDGVDLRLYSSENGILEFDWIVAKAQDFEKIQMVLNGQDGIAFHDDGSATIDLRYQDLTLKMPETYQVIDGVKHNLTAKMVAGDSPDEIRYAISGDIVADQPLVIDPNVAWSTYFDLNDSTLPFDSYVFAVAANSNGVYVSGWARENITNGSFGNYMQVNAGFSQGTATFQNYIYRLDTSGTNITAWTSTGVAANNNTVSNQKLNGAGFDVAADLELFPDGRVLLGLNSGLLQIYSADLSARSYNSRPVTMDSLNSVAIVDNNTFYASGRVAAAIPTAEIAAANIGPDSTYAGGTLGLEGVIIRYTNATTTPTAQWATYVGGAGDEYFTSVALTPDKSKLVFATTTAVVASGGYSALVNAVDSASGAAGTTEILAGVLPNQATVPTAFEVFTFLGGSGNEGTIANDNVTAMVAATNNGFWVAGNTASNDLPGVTTATGGASTGAQSTLGGGIDAFVSFIPLNGSAGAGFQTTYLGGTGTDIIGGIAYDPFKDRLLVFGTTTGNFPVGNTNPASNYFDNSFGGGTYDIYIATLNGALTLKDYATYIGGGANDYLGQTGELVGQGQVYYSPETDLAYLATTVHSTDLPTSVIGTAASSPPGNDRSKNNAANDTHIIIAFNINIFDYGDAPASFDNGNPGGESISSILHLGTTVDAEFTSQNGAAATADDLNNTGSANDEDGVTTLPSLNVGATIYSVNVSALNDTGAATTLEGWIDFNKDGIFQASERATATVPPSPTQQTITLTWNSVPALSVGQSYLRLRLTDNVLTDNGATAIDERSIGIGGVGEVEDYALPISPLTVTPPLVGKTVVSSSESGTTGSSVAVGEIVRYRMYVSLAEGITPDFQIEDFLPTGLRFVNDGTARYAFISTGGNGITSGNATNITGLGTAGGVSGSNAALVGLTSAQVNGVFNDNNISTDANGTGTGDPALYTSGAPVFFRFGTLTNSNADADNEYVVVEFNALVENIPGNSAGTALGNSFAPLIDTDGNGTPGFVSVVRDNGDGVSGAGDTPVTATDPLNDGTGTAARSATASVTVVEPQLLIAKTVRNETNNPGGAFAENVAADAGDLLTFQATFTNTGTAPAFDINIADILPAGVALNGVVTQTSGPALAGLSVTGNTINGSFTNTTGLAVGQSITIRYQGVAGSSVSPNQTVTNTATATWTSLPGTGTAVNPTGSTTPGASGTPTGERNTYSASDTASFTVPAGTFAKALFGTVIPGLPNTNVTVGETVPYALLVTLPEGTTNSLVVSDLLPPNLTYSSFSIVTTAAGSNGLLSANFAGTVPVPVVSGGPFTAGTDPVFTFGPIAVTGDNTAGNNTFLLIVNAVVRNDPSNEGLLPGQTAIANQATFTLPGQPTTTTPPVSVTVVEPQLTIDKRIVGGGATSFDAGDNVPFELVVAHSANSTGPAYDLVMSDPIPVGLQMVPGSAFVFNAPAYATVNFTQNGPTLQVTASELRPGDTITIRYLATVTTATAPGGSITNTATVTADTLPGTGTEQRPLTPVTDSQTVSLFTNSLAGVVWNDLNNNGIYESATESLITAPVRIQLSGTDNLGNAITPIVQTTVGGAYNFTGLRPGTYTLTELDQPAGFFDGLDTPGTTYGGTGTAASDPRNPRDSESITNIVIGTGQNKTGVNYSFGEILGGSIGDFVWEDVNGNGRQDAGELGLDGVTVTLTGLDDSGNPVSLSTTTTGGGAYSFANLRPSGPGGYVVTFVAPSGYSRTVQNSAIATGATNSDGSVATGQTAPINLGVGQNISNIDQGMYRPVTIGNQVWVDANANGLLDAGEPGIPNVQVQLFSAGPDGTFGTADDPAVATTTTNANGQYQFANLPPGTYRVVVNTATLPNGITQQTYDRDGLASPNNDTATLTSGTSDFGFDFGYQGTTANGSMGDTIWLDLNGDGIQQSSEPGLAGVNVTATWLGFDGVLGGGDDIAYTATTDANGKYRIGNLPSGNYIVGVVTSTLLPNLVPTFDLDGAGTPNTTTTTLSLNAGVVQNRTDADFGYRGAASIGDTVYYDVDGDGTQTPGEPGIANATVTLTFAGRDGDLATTADNLTFTTTTNANGNYTFSGIPGGNYRVSVTPPTGYTVPTGDPDGVGTPNTSTLTLGTTEANTTQDFGYRGTAALGDFAFNDLNGNGAQDPAEPGVPGVTVELLDANGTVLDSTTTDTNGNYAFNGLVDSNAFGSTYRVRFTAPAGYVLSSPAGGTSAPVTLGLGQTDNSLDVGLYRPVTIGDRVYFDANGDGVQQVGEPGIPGTIITVTWLGQDGVPSGDDQTFATTTDANGNWTVSNLPPGNFTVQATPPAGYNALTDSLDNGVLAATNPVAITATSEQTRADIDFGFRGTGTVGDRLWLDANGNGTQDPGEPGIGNVTVVLNYTGPNGETATFTTVTDANGNYAFANLPGGTYTVSVNTATLPANVTPTFDADGTATPNASTVTLVAGQVVLTQDFGYRGAASIGDTVYYDVDGDGTQTPGEPGIANATVTLTFAGRDGDLATTADNLTFTTTTNANGNYTFNGIPGGNLNGANPNYRIAVAAPAGYSTPTGDPDGVNTPNTAVLHLAANEANTTQDFGYRGTAALGDFAFNDLNGNGAQDPAEPGVPGVTVELLDANGTVLDSTTTDTNGNYAFNGLVDSTAFGSTYRVRFTAPAGYVLSSPAGGTSAPVTLGLGQTDNSLDVGLYRPVTIGDSVFYDLDGNGTQSGPNEGGLAGVTVNLFYAGVDGVFNGADLATPVATTTTDGNGNYTFLNRQPGLYRVIVDSTTLPSGVTQSTTPTIQDSTTTSGVNDLTKDFGFRGTGTVGDRVFLDLNNDGTFTTGEGLAGVTVQLVGDLNGDGVNETLTTTTGPDGFYQFNNVRASANGTPYTVSVVPATLTTGVANTIDPDGGNDGIANLTLTNASPSNLAQDFGYRGTGVIGNRVWDDTDGNGLQNNVASEPGLPGVTLQLTYAGPGGVFGDGDDLVTTTTSGPNGVYNFTGLPPGNYRVDVVTATLPTNVQPTFDLNGALDNSATRSLTVGESATDVNFGYRGGASVGDTLFLDGNANGIREAVEGGIPGATVTLQTAGADGNLGTADDISYTTTTDANGNYLFQGVAVFNNASPSRTTVSNLPAGLTPASDPDGTLDNTSTFTLGDNEFQNDQDYGYRGNGSISGSVYRDDNNNGTPDAAEPRIAGVTITLSGTDIYGSTVNLTTTTDGNGNYAFNLLAPGTYAVTETQPAGYGDGIDTAGTLGGNNTTNDQLAGIPLGTGQNGTGYNFGERGTTLSGYVFRDDNRDGARTGEPGLAGIQVQVFSAGLDNNLGTADDVLVATTTTDVSGQYNFANLVVPGPYRVLETQPAGYGDSPGTPALFRDIFLPSSGLAEQNFGETLGAVSGTVYVDVNGNNTLDAGDGRIANVTVTLTGNDITGTAVFRTAVSDSNGNYSFSNLLQSDANGYRIDETQPTPPYTPGAANVGTINGTTTGAALSNGNQVAGIVLPAGQSGINYNFGEFLTPNTTFIAGSVYLDSNRDGTRQTGEQGFGGVTITLLDANGAVVATTTTANDGTYLFQGVPAGANYTIFETQPSTLGDSPAGPARTIAVTNLPALGLGNQNFGETLGSISGTVYFDANNNGVQDAGEPGIAGAAVQLFGTDVNGGDIPPSIFLTDANGNYSFGNLPAGTYTLQEGTPTGYVDGGDSLGSAGGVVGNDIVTQIPLSGGQLATGYNFGETSVAVSGNVFYDRNRDGTQNNGETAIAGVTIQLFDTNGNVVATTTTDGTGTYRFLNVAPGNYTVVELQPAGYGDPLSGPFAVNSRPITVGGTPVVNQNFADTLSTLGGFVFVDSNNNGAFDIGETPILNTQITLTGTDVNGNAVTRTAFTDATGQYLITDLPAGTYQIVETQPSPYLDGRDTAGVPGGGNTSVNDTISAIPLAAGVDFANYNFAELAPPAAFISGSVYLDRNNDGSRNGADGPLSGVTITLTNTTTGATTSTTTDANGNYFFNNLVAGNNYTVTESQPPLYGNGLENPSNTVTLTNLPATGVPGVNFGERAGTVSGTVYFDRDNSGTFNAGDTPIAGVLIALGGAFPNGGGVFVNTTVTDANGNYSFTDLPAASYTITETQPSGYSQGVNTPGTPGTPVNGDTIGQFDLLAGGTSSGNLFGERAATVSGRVFNDVNRDGIPTLNSGIGGVTVQLVDSSGVVVATTTTGPDGVYTFINVVPGTYSIVETQPAVYGNSPVGPATVNNVTVPAGGLSDQNFGETLARLSGSVFLDFNSNGIQDTGETGIAGVSLSISGQDVLGNIIPPSVALTDANGNYTFTELRAGTYTISESQPAAYGDGTDSQGTVGGVVTNDVISNIPLSAGVITTGYTFAELGGVIGGFVFQDDDNDGIQSPVEGGINGVIVTLTGTSVDGTAINAIASTDPNGFFEFRNLPAGTYTITEEEPNGYLDGTDTVSLVGGGTQGTDPVGNDQVTAITLPPGGNANDYSFGEILPSTIAGTVYVDQNRNGVRDSFETGVAGVTVTVTGTDDRGNAVNLTQTTGANGTYSFSNLRPGTYTILETQPTGYSQSGNEVGNAGGILAPVDQIQTIVLAPNQTGSGYNFGELLQPAVVPPITVPPGTGPAFPRPTKRAFLGSSPTGGSVQTLPNFANLRPANPTAPSNLLATGDGPGSQNLRVLDITTGTERINTTPFPTSTGGLRTAVGDVTGDSVQDVAVATGPGSDSTVKIYNGNTGQLQSQFLAFEPAWRGGVFLATGDFNNDGKEDIVVSRDSGGTAQVKIFSGADTSVVLADFNALADPNFTGGVRIAVGDINKDGRVDLVATGGAGGTARVLVWNGTTLVPNAVPTQLFGEFVAFPNTFTGGAFVAVGDTNGDGYGDIIVSKDAGSTPEVKVFNGRDLSVNNTLTVAADFNAFDATFTGGVRVAAMDTNNDGISEIVAGSGPGQLELVRFYTANGVLLDTYSANYQGNKGGVYVGA